MFIDGVLKEFPWIRKYPWYFIMYGVFHYFIVFGYCLLTFLYPNQAPFRLFQEALPFGLLFLAGTFLVMVGLRARQ